MFVCVLTWPLLGIKKSLGHAQIGLLYGFNSKFPTSIPSPFICGAPPPPTEFYWNRTVVLSQSLGYLWAYPGLIHYILLICENVSLDWSTMQPVGNYGCQ